MTMPRAELMMLPVGKIKRHPTAQRPAQPKRWEAKVGKFNPDEVGAIVACSNGNGGWLAIEGGHRVEAGQAALGPAWQIPALVYKRPLTDEQAARIFVSSDRKMDISTRIKHAKRVQAKDGDAIFVEEQKSRIPRTQTVGAFYTILKAHGRGVLEQTITLAIKVWGKQAEFPGSFMVGLARLVAEAKSGADITSAGQRLARRRASPSQWLDRARTRKARFGGNGNLPDHLRILLRGR